MMAPVENTEINFFHILCYKEVFLVKKIILSNPLLYVSMFKPDILRQSPDKEAISFPCLLLQIWFLSFTNYKLKNTVMKIVLKNKALKPRKDNQQVRELYFWAEATWDSKFQTRYIV